MKRQFVLIKGEHQAVIRPENPALALKLWHEHLKDEKTMTPEQRREASNKVVGAQAYRFLGLLGVGRRVLDEKGRSIGKLKLGDTWMPYSEYRRVYGVVKKIRAAETLTIGGEPTKIANDVEAAAALAELPPAGKGLMARGDEHGVTVWRSDEPSARPVVLGDSGPVKTEHGVYDTVRIPEGDE